MEIRTKGVGVVLVSKPKESLGLFWGVLSAPDLRQSSLFCEVLEKLAPKLAPMLALQLGNPLKHWVLLVGLAGFEIRTNRLHCSSSAS